MVATEKFVCLHGVGVGVEKEIRMRIVSYNVNGLRARVSSHGSLLKLLNSLQADIICFQETKLSRRELSVDLCTADGYEAFFSCSRLSTRGRVQYSGVATFCKVSSPFSSEEVTLPLSAEEGFTGLLTDSKLNNTVKCNDVAEFIECQLLEGLSRHELVQLDNEGRCLVTDHGHFVLFNIYGPRASSLESERFQFKLKFFTLLQRRWEAILNSGRTVIVVGDLNIAPFRLDSCDPGPDFEDNLCRKWFRKLLKFEGGPFVDTFRFFHPERSEAYTCWSQASGAEEFNYGTRIDHILVAGSCLHKDVHIGRHEFISCHVKECDILINFKRSMPEKAPEWHGGRVNKIEGSDHAPIFVELDGLPPICMHSVPALAARYMPEVSGQQQSIVSFLKKKFPETQMTSTSECSERLLTVAEAHLDGACRTSNEFVSSVVLSSASLDTVPSEVSFWTRGKCKDKSFSQVQAKMIHAENKEDFLKENKKIKRTAQCNLLSYFKRQSTQISTSLEEGSSNISQHSEFDSLYSNKKQEGTFCLETAQGDLPSENIDSISIMQMKEKTIRNTIIDTLRERKSSEDMSQWIGDKKETEKLIAISEWQKIHELMAKKVPLCVGHGEPCVFRVVKKPGPNIGRGFYVCARAEGPASNPEARCNHFEWSTSQKRRK